MRPAQPLRAGYMAGTLAVLLAAASPRAAAQVREFHGDPVPPEVDAMYERGMAFLLATQMEDGTWPAQGSGQGPATTAMALLALMARGDCPAHGPAAGALRRGVHALIGMQAGDTGFFGPTMYHHGFATLALAEAYGMVEHPRLAGALRQAVELILVSQRENPTGGWRYQPTARDADTTVSGAQMVALLAARNAGIEVPDEAIRRGLEYFAACQAEDGGIGYTSAGSGNAVRTAIAITSAALAGETDTPLVARATNFLAQAESRGAHGSTGGVFYHFYYAAQAWFHTDMDQWRAWNAAQIARLSQIQHRDGHWSERQGPTIDTAWGLLSIALNYRTLPIYERQ